MNIENNRILVIDDNPAIHEDFRKILSGAGGADSHTADAEAILFGASSAPTTHGTFEVDSAFQGAEGLSKVQHALGEGRPYALAFVDVRMPPGWDGIETINHLWVAYPLLQVVICTAYSDYSWSDIMGHLGGSDNLLILKKPFDNIEVLQLAHALTRKWALSVEAARRMADLDDLVQQRTEQLQAANDRLRKEMDERLGVEEERRLSDERFSMAFQASPIPLAIYSPQRDRLVDVNDRFLEISGSPAPGQPALEVRLRQDGKCLELQTLGWERRIRNLRCTLQRQDGLEREVLLSTETLNLRGEPHLLVILPDVTDQLRLEEQLRQAQKMETVGTLAAGIAHDFGNILTVIQGHAQIHLSLGVADRKMAGSLREIANASERAAGLVRQLLSFSRKQVTQPRVIDLNATIRGLGRLLRRLIGEHIRLECELGAPLPAIFADPCNLEQIIINLAANARDAMPQGGRLVLRTEVVANPTRVEATNRTSMAGRYVCLSVIDTGCGMDQETLRRSFEPFFSSKPPGHGTGMGLTTVQTIVKQHGGWITVHSTRGKGTSFRIYLPASDRLDTVFIRRSGTPGAGSGHGTILVVEDEKSVRVLIKSALKRAGYRVFAADGAEKALEIWHRRSGRFDLLLTDLVIPGGTSGQTLAENLKGLNKDLRVVYTTGYSLESVGVNGDSLNGGLFIAKPFTLNALADTVAAAIAGPGVQPAAQVHES